MTIRPVHADAIEEHSGTSYPEPFASRMGPHSWKNLGDAFGLTQYGVAIDTLGPGAQSALRHWHTLEDELVYMLEGELVLVTNEGETTMTAGMVAGFKAGVRDAHHLVNRSDKAARFLVVGSRIEGERSFYPDDDLMWVWNEDGRYAAHKDGTPYPRRG